MIYSILSSKGFVISILTQQTFVCSKSTIRSKSEMCSQLTIKSPRRRHRRRSSVFIFNLEQFSHLNLEFDLLTLKM